MIDIASVGERGQVTLPKDIRDALGLKAGDKVAFVNLDGNYIIKKVDEASLRDFLLIDHKEKYDARKK